MREPAFWWRAPGAAARLLAPLAASYGAIARWRLRQRGRRAVVPVVCLGDPTVGGAGKTPTAIATARMLIAAGERPAFLTRGYGGKQAGLLRIDPAQHRAADVGDEPLLLARTATTIVSRARVKGAQAAVAAGASVIVMDDGFQNPSLAKDFSLLIVDAGRGIGNGSVVPAGPLRAPLAAQLARAHALLVIGDGLAAAEVAGRARARNLPVFQARLEPDAGIVTALGGGRVLAFAGIGSPEKFFTTLTGAGIAVAATRAFPDHHRFTSAEAEALCAEADREGLVLLTTEKDLARMHGDAATTELAARAQALPVTLALGDEADFQALLLERIAAGRAGN
jgi:tetraacyldisaccharide 4'-kinase